MSLLTRNLRRALWEWRSHLPGSVSCGVTLRATALIACYNETRARNVGPQVRHLLHCPFIERVVISNHNPDLVLDGAILQDPRVFIVEQAVRRGCGHRWTVARTFDPEYLITIDDDILLYPAQVARLFEQLVLDPSVPHGLSGMWRDDSTEFKFVERHEVEVDFLCETYALTRHHLSRYWKVRAELAADGVADLIDGAMDFVVISQMGDGRPRIHDLGRLRRCETFAEVGIAVHRNADFGTAFHQVWGALQARHVGSNAPDSAWDGPVRDVNAQPARDGNRSLAR
ncbi:MAG: hypothetical protein AB7I50_26720 [Vicinamibacterales bacterium]